MFLIENNNITMTKGDSGKILVRLKNKDGTEYQVTGADEVVFSVKRKKESYCPLVLEKKGVSIVFESGDTKELASGEYVYDVVIKRSTGEVYTAVEGKLTIRKAVHEFE